MINAIKVNVLHRSETFPSNRILHKSSNNVLAFLKFDDRYAVHVFSQTKFLTSAFSVALMLTFSHR